MTISFTSLAAVISTMLMEPLRHGRRRSRAGSPC